MELLLKNACSVPFGYVQGAGRQNYCLKNLAECCSGRLTRTKA